MTYCTYCGSELPDDAPACPKCGHPRAGVAVGRRRTDGNAVASLVLGILGVTFCPFIPSIIAVILGSQARAKIAQEPDLEGDPMAKAGVILGWVGIGLAVLGLIAAVLIIVFSSSNLIDMNDFDF